LLGQLLEGGQMVINIRPVGHFQGSEFPEEASTGAPLHIVVLAGDEGPDHRGCLFASDAK
ncbi:unnamed protein product, partial [Aphanomyces euteiches]